MVLIYMDGQDKSDQIKDWKICTEKDSDKLMLKVEFPSGKFFYKPLDQCVIEPTIDCKGNLLHNKKRIRSVLLRRQYIMEINIS